MWLPTLALLLSLLAVEARGTSCKATPNDASWPSVAQWRQLNDSLSGRLLQPSPPALACHLPSLPGAEESCANITSAWGTFAFHQDNPVSTAWNNMNNDSCLPDPSLPCSDRGYPVYVVNATSADHVKSAIDFARRNNVRLNVKASGHDYMGRSAAPYSLSIWTRYMVGGYVFHDQFQPQGCASAIDTTAVTAGAASYVADVYANLRSRNLTAVDGMGPEVTMGGYLTGGGHSPISNIFGLGADQVYEVEMVTPQGEILTANECQNTDLFWAVRGGGGGTFGVLTKVTVRTVPSTPFSVFEFIIEAPPNATAYWDSVAYLYAQFPTLSRSNVTAFTYMYPNASSAGLGNGSAFRALFALYDPASEDMLEDMLKPAVQHINSTYAGQITTTATSILFPDFYSLFKVFADDAGAGRDKVVGSRLLPPDTLTHDAFRDALIAFAGDAGADLYMVAGNGVWDARPRGGGNAINPAWRKALVHAVTTQYWTPGNATERAAAERKINDIQVAAMRQLTPGSGAYINEAYWKEPNFQQAFWGSHYPRLRAIKKAVDPDDVLWCPICVGSEGWKEVGDYLCRAQ